MVLRLVVLTAIGIAVARVGPAQATPLDYIVVDPPRLRAATATKIVYVNRCLDGCTVTRGADDAAANTSSILGREGIPTTVSLEPFWWSQATWDAVVTCVRERFAPWALTVVTEPPASGLYQEVMVAGVPSEMGLAGGTLGVAPLTSNCSALPTAIGFVFANDHPAEEVDDLCTTIIHETGHLYGLDHEHACKDPMTYLSGCTPKVFVNRTLPCGEFDERPCQCSTGQNSFAVLMDRLGPGPQPAAPVTRILAPVEGTEVPPRFSVSVAVDSPRQIAEMTLWVNGRSWVSIEGRSDSEPHELVTPVELPDGQLALEVHTRDDLGNVSVVTTTAIKGAACTTATTCADGQTCVDGACRSGPGTRGMCAACTRDDDCALRMCTAVDGDGVCSQPCWPLGAACGDGLTCQTADDESYACLPIPDDGGCCSTGRDPRAAVGLALLTLVAVGRRRRR